MLFPNPIFVVVYVAQRICTCAGLLDKLITDVADMSLLH